MKNKLICLELCAGGGGQALGLEMAGFDHAALLDNDAHCCKTLINNRPDWKVIEGDLKRFNASEFNGIDLLAAGLPCPPFSIAGKQLGPKDDRDLFPHAIRIIKKTNPTAVMIENVRGFLGAIFEDYRLKLKKQLKELGYESDWRLLNASDFGVPQLRPRVVIVAIKHHAWPYFQWPSENQMPPTVGDTLKDLMAASKWRGAVAWAKNANDIAPTIVGGSLKHGGPDLGPTRAKQAWASLGVDGKGIANAPPSKDFVGMPKLTVRMVARLQGFPDDWHFSGGKTAAYRQVGNAFPPPVAAAVAKEVALCLAKAKKMRAA
jgi:DNA (cytosine-5)-methyltransferase 1